MAGYEEKRAALFADMAAVFEFFSYDTQPTLDRFIEAARHIQEFDEHAVVVVSSAGDIRVHLSDGLALPRPPEELQLSDFYPGESALYLVDEVTSETANVLFEPAGPVRSYAMVPLVTQNEVIGLFILGSRRTAAFEPEMQDLFFSLGSYLAVAIENIRHYERSQDRLKVLISLQESQHAIASVIEIDRILAKIAEESLKTLGVSCAAIYVKDEGGGTWERRVFRSRVPAVPGPARVLLSELPSPLERVLGGAETALLGEAEADLCGAFRFSPRFSAIVVVPFRTGETTTGFALLESTRIDGERQYLIQLFAGQAQVLFSNAMLVKGLREKTTELERSHKLVREYADSLQKSHEMLENRVRELTTLHDVSAALVSKTEIDELLNYILDRACTVMRADKGSLLLLEEDELHARCTRGTTHGTELKFRLGEGVAGLVAKTGQPRIVENVRTDPRYVAILPGVAQREETMLAVPLSLDDRVIGVLNVDRELKYGVFTPEEERLLLSLASSAAEALGRAQHLREMRDLHLETLEAFAMAVDTKDAYTHGHSRRVGHIAVQVATMLRLPSEEIEVIARAALLHDIGKIGISNAILFKPGRLTEEEYEIMKAHVIWGENILKPIKRMAAEARLVRHHHERWDGKGYPDGLSGEQIPIGAAIISVGDAYDTMTSDRPYRRSLGRDVAVEELQKCSGTQFNPLVVGAFLMVSSRKEFTVETSRLDLKMEILGG